VKHLKTVRYNYEEKIVDFATCDMCKEKIQDTGAYDVNDVRVSHEFGEHYPEDRYTTTVSVDLCGKCFDNRLVPWLKEQGCEVHTEES
jgi:hypothetical protein